MINTKEKDLKLELLVATMHRNSLEFLSKLFPDENFSNFNILIVNQTTKKNLLESHLPNIRVINSFETGLSKSRNIAIANATGDVCLFVDDDVKFKPGLELSVLKAHQNNINASIITFMMEDFDGKLFKNYPQVKHHNLKSIQKVNSVVITFKRTIIQEQGLLFDTNFGLGSTFETADEYIFMRESLKLKSDILFEPKSILSHHFFSSGQDSGNDKLIFARSALYYKYSGLLGYIKLCKHLYLIHQQGYIKTRQIFNKFKIGLKGIKTYKSILKSRITHS